MSKSQQVVIIDGGTFGMSAAIEFRGRDYEIPPPKARAFPVAVCSGILDRPVDGF